MGISGFEENDVNSYRVSIIKEASMEVSAKFRILVPY